jgi:hypothetical protein
MAQETQNMNRQPVLSSMIRAWAFDPASSVLEIEFQNGRIYEYREVPEFLARGFAAAQSKGQFFLSRIADRYTCEEISPES